MNKPFHAAAFLGGALVALAACNPAGSGPSRSVAIHLAATAGPVGAATAGPLNVTALQLVIDRAALGSGDQFGCIDCQGNTAEAPFTPKLIDVPLTGGTVAVAVEQASLGRYTQAEIGLTAPSPATTTPATWPTGATFRIAGTFNGTPFEIVLPVSGDFRVALTPPVDVSATGGPATADVTISLPVQSWFTASGTMLDPTNPAQRSQVEANIRAAFPAEIGGGGEAPNGEGGR